MERINSGAHCSECIWYEACANCQMYCKYLQRRITARKTPKFCNGYQRNNNERDTKSGKTTQQR